MIPADILTPSEAARLVRWGKAIGWDGVATRAGTTPAQASRAARLQPVRISALAALRALIVSEPEEGIAAVCCTCGAPIEGATSRWRQACSGCREATRQARLRARRAYMVRWRQQLKKTSAPARAPSVEISPCPECGAARRRDGPLIYCPRRRCEAGLVLVKKTK